eukprot:gene30058-35026_t
MLTHRLRPVGMRTQPKIGAKPIRPCVTVCSTSNGFGEGSRSTRDSASSGGFGELRKNWKNLGPSSPAPKKVSMEGIVKGEIEWRTMDKKVNKYPGLRSFTVIGEGGPAYRSAMVEAIQSVVGKPIPEDNVKERESSGAKYLSVTIGPVMVEDADQVVTIFSAVRADSRTKYCM